MIAWHLDTEISFTLTSDRDSSHVEVGLFIRKSKDMIVLEVFFSRGRDSMTMKCPLLGLGISISL